MNTLFLDEKKNKKHANAGREVHYKCMFFWIINALAYV